MPLPAIAKIWGGTTTKGNTKCHQSFSSITHQKPLPGRGQSSPVELKTRPHAEEGNDDPPPRQHLGQHPRRYHDDAKQKRSAPGHEH